MVAGAANCPDVLPGELGGREMHDRISGHGGWDMVSAVRVVAVQPAESSKAIL
jgi:hypothetical protein